MHIERRRQSGEVIFILLLLAFSLFLLYHAYLISGFESYTSAGAYPMVTTGVMIASGLVALFQTMKTPREPGLTGESLGQQFRRVLTPNIILIFTIVSIGYMVLLEKLGFIITSYLFLIISMRILGSRNNLLNLAVAALSLGIIYVVFQTIFSVTLPASTWLEGVLQ